MVNLVTPKSKAPMSGSLAQAIARCEATQAAYDAASRDDDDAKILLSEAESDAIEVLSGMPCASDAEFLEKLRYLHAYEIRLGGKPTGRHEFGSVVLAVDCHFSPPPA
jgi:hypothetical protein